MDVGCTLDLYYIRL